MKKTSRKPAAGKKAAAPRRGTLLRSRAKDHAAAKSGVANITGSRKSGAPATPAGSSSNRDFPDAVYQDERRS